MRAEILSPAGSIEALYAGINAGADAVYIGGSKFGARAYADNPDETDLLKAIDYVHLQDKKVYMTVNTLLKNQEIEEELYNYLLPYYNQGLDAIIVQDLGVFGFIKNNFPDFDLHASTQMAITSENGAKLMKKMGASRIVTARELSLKEIKRIHDQVDIEIESFIHGAMCYSYSGQCLFSSIIGGRSGNRGRCAGPCRQPYQVYDENGKQINENDQQYVLSMKDMNTLSILPDILDAGVYSLKIEGRMKSPEYAAGVVSIYRKYLDLFLQKGREAFQIDNIDYQNLSDLYSRSGSTTGYYEIHNSKKMISLSKPAYKTESDSFVSQIQQKYVNKRYTIPVDATVELHIGQKSKMKIASHNCEISLEGTEVQAAKNSPLSKESIYKQVDKTGDTNFILENIQIDMDDHIFMPVKQLNELRRQSFQQLEEELLKKYRRSIRNTQQLNYGNENTATTISDQNNQLIKQEKSKEYDVEYPVIYCQVNTMQQLECILQKREISTIYLACDFLTVEDLIFSCKKVKEKNRGCFIVLPFILRTAGIQYLNQLFTKIDNTIYDGFIVRNIDEINFLQENKINHFSVDSSVYVMNNNAYHVIKLLGAERITHPFELNYNELKKQSNKDYELVVYGKIPLMISAGCINKTLLRCEHKINTFKLRDRKSAEFTVNNSCNFCYNILYNNFPISLLNLKSKVDTIDKHNIRLNFTTESSEEVKEILDKYIKVFYYNEYSEEIPNYTRGHFNRGVE